MEWEALEQFHLNPPTAQLPRKDEVQQSYMQHKSRVEASGRKMADVLKDRTFPTDSPTNPFVILPNDFPYHVSSEIAHWLIWIFPRYFTEKGQEEINKELDALLREKGLKKFIFFKNLSSNSSIPSVPHYHLFIQNEDVPKLSYCHSSS
jgi:hypothetical protein